MSAFGPNDLLNYSELAKTVASQFPGHALNLTTEQVERLGQELNVAVPAKRPGFTPRDYWTALKAEIRLLLCTDEKKYKELREKARALKGQPQIAIVGAIAGVVGSVLGVAAGVISPFVALLLAFCAKVGVEAFCRAMQQPGIAGGGREP